MDFTSTVAAPAVPSNTTKSKHQRGNSLFRSFSGQPASAKLQQKQTYGKKKSHKSTLTQSHIDKKLWDQPDSGSLSAAIDAALQLKKTPSLSEMSSTPSPSSSPSTDSSSISPYSGHLFLSGINEPQDTKTTSASAAQWEIETSKELDRVRSLSNSHGPPDIATLTTKPKQRPISSISVNSTSSKITLDPTQLKPLAPTATDSSTSSCSRSSSLIRSKHTSTASTISTLRHFSIISIDARTNANPLPEVEIPSDSTTSTPTFNRISPPANEQHNTPPSSLETVPDSTSRYQISSNAKTTPKISSSPSAQSLNSLASVQKAPSFSFSADTGPSLPIDRSKLREKQEGRLGIHSNNSHSSMLSYKKENIKYMKNVSKASISQPSALIACEDHFSSVPTESPVIPRTPDPYKRGHRSRSSVIASISHSNIFKSFKRDPSPSDSPNLNEPRTPYASTSTAQLSTQRSKQSFSSVSSQQSASTGKRKPFSDMRKSIMSMSPSSNLFRSSNSNLSSRKSFLGMSSFSFPTNSGSEVPNSVEKTMISLPTPIETSREKLKNKLRASTSLLSLTRSDMHGSLAVAVPVEQHNLSQMEKLLSLCKTPTVMDFQSYIYRASTGGTISKLNEASYSEVFIQENTKLGYSKIYKIIPFGNEELDQSPIQDILQELGIAKLVMSLDGFVDILDVAVVRGKYPAYLLSMWDQYNDEYGSENYRPDSFSDSQLYCVIVQSNAGTDLERYELDSWTDAESVFWQTVVALAQAEERYQFEHRDLHWGNIVIADKADEELNTEDLMNKLTITESSGSPVSPNPSSPFASSFGYDPGMVEETRNLLLARSTLKITLIDYTLSRANSPDGVVIHTRMDQPEFFRGKGDYQFDIYRFMRSHVMSSNVSRSSSNAGIEDGAGSSNTPQLLPNSSSTSITPTTPTTPISREIDGTGVDWSTFCPRTNVLWLHYLADKLINHKGLKYIATTRSGRIISKERYNTSSSSLREAYLNGDGANGAQGSSGGPITGGSDYKSTFEGDLLAEEARACKALETISRSIDPRKKRLGGGSSKKVASNMTFQDFESANDVLKWGIKAKVFPAYSSVRN